MPPFDPSQYDPAPFSQTVPTTGSAGLQPFPLGEGSNTRLFGGTPIGLTGNKNFTIDLIFGSLLAQQGALSRFNQFGNKNPFENLGAGLDPSLKNIGSLRGSLDALPQQLTAGALGSTTGAQVAALQAARTAGGARGGLGNAVAQASRASQGAAVGQSAALANALVQGNVARAQFESGLNQQEFAARNAQLLAKTRSAQFEESQLERSLALQQNLANLLAGLAQPGSQIDIARGQQGTARDVATISGISQIGASAVGNSGGGGSQFLNNLF